MCVSGVLCRAVACKHRSIQSWKLADIKRDDYAPNTPGQRQWEMDRKKWLAQRLVDVVKVGLRRVGFLGGLSLTVCAEGEDGGGTEQWSGSGAAQSAELCSCSVGRGSSNVVAASISAEPGRGCAAPWFVLCCAVQEAGYDESSQLLVEDVMMGKNVPDPRDIRKYDLIGVFGMVNYRTLRVSGRDPWSLSVLWTLALCCGSLCTCVDSWFVQG